LSLLVNLFVLMPTLGHTESGPTQVPTPNGRRMSKADWRHVLEVLDRLTRSSSSDPLVVLLGGSSARESTIRDQSWQGQVRRVIGYDVTCRNLATSSQSFAEALAVISALPARSGAQVLVYIGVNPNRFCVPEQSAQQIQLELRHLASLPARAVPEYRQHIYDDQPVDSPVEKRRLVQQWSKGAATRFRRSYAYNFGMLRRVIEACQARGMHPVLLNLPRDESSLGEALDLPSATYEAQCLRLAHDLRVPWVDFTGSLGLKASDFHDLWHLVKGPGRSRWQRMLSQTTASLLNRYGPKPWRTT